MDWDLLKFYQTRIKSMEPWNFSWNINQNGTRKFRSSGQHSDQIKPRPLFVTL